MKEIVESFAVFFQLTILYMGPLFGMAITIYLLFFTNLWPIVILYLTWIYLDRETPSTCGRRMSWMQNNFLWQHYNDYFPHRMVKTSDWDPSNNYIVCLFPHGILATAAIAFFNGASKAKEYFPETKFYGLTLDCNFYMPIAREIILSYGGMSVSKKSMMNILSSGKGKALVMCPGGSAEAYKAQPGKYRLAIKNKKGFVKIAIATGTNLVPAIAFGENELFNSKNPASGSTLDKVLVFLRKKTGVAFTFFSGGGVFNIMPFRKTVTTVIGKPIIIKQNKNITDEEVDKVHDEFIKCLNHLFEEHKGKYLDNPESTFLAIED